MSGEKQVDLVQLCRERDKRQAALSEVCERIAGIETAAKLVEEKREQRQREVAGLEKKLATCREMVSWIANKLAETEAIAEAQVGLALAGSWEGLWSLRGTLEEIAAWKSELLILRKFETSLPKAIEKMRASGGGGGRGDDGEADPNE